MAERGCSTKANPGFFDSGQFDLGQFDSDQLAQIVDFVCVCVCCVCVCVLFCVGPRFGCSPGPLSPGPPPLRRTRPSAGPPLRRTAGASHDSPRTPNVHISGTWRFKHHQNSTKRPPRERTKKEKCGGKGGKKSDILGPPPFGPPTLWGPTHPSGELCLPTTEEGGWGEEDFGLSRTNLYEIFFWPKSKKGPVGLSRIGPS